MKKFFFPLLTLALAVVTFASCSSNDDSNDYKKADPSQSTNQSTSENFYAAKYIICDEIAELGDFTLVVSDGTKSSEYDLVKNGKHTKFTFKGEVGEKSVYEFSLTQPSNKPLKYTIKFTPNDKAKALTENDRTDAFFAFGYGQGTSSLINIGISQFGLGDITGGNYTLEYIDAALDFMSK